MNKIDDYYMANVLIAIATFGLLIKLYLSSVVNIENSNYKAESTIIGYGLILCCITALMFFKINIKNVDPLAFIGIFLKQSLPYLLIIFLLSFIIFLNIKYFDKINTGKVGDQYNIVTGVSTFMFLFQLYFIYKYYLLSLDYKYKPNSIIESEKVKYRMMNYVFVPINFSLIAITYTILKNFLTDG